MVRLHGPEICGALNAMKKTDWFSYVCGLIILSSVLFLGATQGWTDGNGNFTIPGNLTVTGTSNSIGGTSFVNPKLFVASFTQSGTDAPVTLTVIYNSTGITPTWSRAASGDYRLTFSGATATKFFPTLGLSANSTTTQQKCSQNLDSGDDVVIYTFTTAGIAADIGGDAEFPNVIKVEIYP